MRRIQARRRVLTAYEPPEPREWREPYRKRNARRLAVRKLRARLDDGRRFLLFCKNRPDWLLWWVEVGMLVATEIMMLAALCDAFKLFWLMLPVCCVFAAIFFRLFTRYLGATNIKKQKSQQL